MGHPRFPWLADEATKSEVAKWTEEVVEKVYGDAGTQLFVPAGKGASASS